jgi:tight adherence protein B
VNQILFAVLGSSLLLGAALFWVLRTDRHSKSRQLRLRGIVAAAPVEEGPRLSLRRPSKQQGLRGLFSPTAALLARLDAAFAAAGNRIGVPHLVIAGMVAAAMIAGFASRVLGLNSALVALLAGAAAVGAPVLVLRLAQSRYQRHFLEIFPDALDLIVRAVRAGLPALDAIEGASREIADPVGTEFRRMLEETQIGVDLETALHHTADRVRLQDFRFFVVSLVLQRRTGGGLAETLANLSTIVRQRKALRLKARALTAETKASTVVISIMPFVAAAGLLWIAPDVFSVLFIDPRGRFMLGVAIVFQIVGIAVMYYMIKRTLR